MMQLISDAFIIVYCIIMILTIAAKNVHLSGIITKNIYLVYCFVACTIHAQDKQMFQAN